MSTLIPLGQIALPFAVPGKKVDPAKPKPPQPIYIIDSCGGIHSVKKLLEMRKYIQRRQ